MRSGTVLSVLICLLSITVVSHSDSPPPNTIPVIGLKPDYKNIDTEFFCMLSWHNFDGLSRQYYEADSILAKVVLSGDTTGMLTVINPWNITCVTNWYAHMFAMNTDSAYSRPGWKDLVYYVGSTAHTCNDDTLLAKKFPSEMITEMTTVAEYLETLFNQNSHSVWLYYGYDEAPAIQWNRMVTDSIDLVYAEYDDYMPSLFTQAMDSVYRPDIDSTVKWQPSFETVDPRGVISWMNHYIKREDSSREFCYVISTMHTIKDWAGAHNIDDDNNGTPPNFATQARVVRSLFSMKYRGYNPSGPQPALENNYPHFIAQDAYPFRLVGTQYQNSNGYTQHLGDSLENWMLDHYEEGMDSTFITAWHIRNTTMPKKDISVLFVPQSFGRAGGTGMWDTIPGPPQRIILGYDSYNYRIPTPQEFLMNCNSALIRQAKAILPYCLTTYAGGQGDYTDAGLLDENNIPYDAPYERWVYSTRPTDDITFIPPDSIAPFIDGYDPLYDLPSRPVPAPSNQRNRENYLKWKFAAYGRLWNSIKRTFGSIAQVAPELARLSWWENRENEAVIRYDRSFVPIDFRGPQIKVFTDSTHSSCYLYYLNRYCRANNNPYRIVVETGDFPRGTPFSEYALDHSRRCLIEGEMTARDEYTFFDTLAAGEARLLQMIDPEYLPADVRITDPDVNTILPARGDTLADNRSPAGEQVDVLARFYNMGTGSKTGIWAFLYDETNGEKLDSAKISFDGLSTDSCWNPDRTDVIFNWSPDSTDTGVHVLKVYAETWVGEPDSTDNSAHLVHVVDPRDYATAVRHNPWDMTEARTDIPAWYTNDISAVGGLWKSTGFSDSVSGMFEGVLDPAIIGPILKGDIRLSVPGNSAIDTDIYRNLSLGAVCMNHNTSGAAGSVLHLWWVSSSGDTLTANLSNESEIGAIMNGTDQWKTYGPLDLSTVSGLGWNSEEATDLWLSFRTGKPPAPMVPQPVDIRIGWVKLTE